MPRAMSVSRMKTRQSLKSEDFGRVVILLHHGSGENANF